MQKFKSTIEWKIFLTVLIFIGIFSIIMIYKQIWVGLTINIIVFAFIFYILFFTCYILKNNELIIKSGFFILKTIRISSIHKIVDTDKSIGNTTPSQHRIIIYYNEKDSVLISPINKTEFLNRLRQINPKINIAINP